MIKKEYKGKKKEKREYSWDRITAEEFEKMEFVISNVLALPSFPIKLLKRVFMFDDRLITVGKDTGFNSKNFVFFLKHAISNYLLGRNWNEDNPHDKNWRKDFFNAYTIYIKTGLTRFDNNRIVY